MRLSQEQAIDKLGIVCKRSVVKEVTQLLERKSWKRVHLSNIPQEERKRIILGKMQVRERLTRSSLGSWLGDIARMLGSIRIKPVRLRYQLDVCSLLLP